MLANEGLAEYTGVRVGAGARATTIALKRLDSINERPSLIRSFGYVVGPGYGLLLDRVSRQWRTAAIKGVPLPSLLARATGTSPSTRDKAYGRAEIVAEETARDLEIQERRAELTAKLLNGPTVTFPFEAMSIDFDPNTLFSLGDAGTVYARSTTVRDKWGSFQASGDVLLSSDWSYARLPGPAVMSGNRLSGPQWTAELAPGYMLAPGSRPDELIVKKQ